MTIKTLSIANALVERITYLESKLKEAGYHVQDFDFTKPGLDDCGVINVLREFSEEAIGTHEYAKILLTFVATSIKKAKDDLEAL